MSSSFFGLVNSQTASLALSTHSPSLLTKIQQHSTISHYKSCVFRASFIDGGGLLFSCFGVYFGLLVDPLLGVRGSSSWCALVHVQCLLELESVMRVDSGAFACFLIENKLIFINVKSHQTSRNDHTTVTAPLPVCSAKLSTVGPG